MAVPGIDFRFSNTAAWTDGFSVQVGADIAVPWVGTPAWAPGASYDLGLARVYGEDLYIADPGLGSGSWTAAATFEADVRPSGLSRWLLVGAAAGYRRTPYNFTGKHVVAALKACDPAGSITDPRVKLLVGDEDGGFLVTNAALGGLAWNVPRGRTRAVAAGLYRYDIVATGADEVPERIRFGLCLVDEGICP
jgi:hypothetical protein